MLFTRRNVLFASAVVLLAAASNRPARVVIVGSTTSPGSTRFALVRYNSNGTRDTSNFGTQALVTTSFSTLGYPVALGNAVKIDSQNRIVVAGRVCTVFGGGVCDAAL